MGQIYFSTVLLSFVIALCIRSMISNFTTPQVSNILNNPLSSPYLYIFESLVQAIWGAYMNYLCHTKDLDKLGYAYVRKLCMASSDAQNSNRTISFIGRCENSKDYLPASHTDGD
jgi:hypothetical protein